MRPVVRQVRVMARTQLRAREGRSELAWEDLERGRTGSAMASIALGEP